MKAKTRLLQWVLGLFLLAAIVLTAAYFLFAEREAPAVSLAPEREAVSPKTEMTLELSDPGSGLAAVTVTAVQDGQAKTLLEERFGQGVRQASRGFTFQGQGFTDGPVTLRITARDASWANLLQGNVLERTVSLRLDTQPPQVTLESFRHNLNRGGSGLAGFTVSEEVSRAGITVDGRFFPAYKQDNGLFLCFFSFPYDADPGAARPLVVVEDAAGNTSRAGFHYYVNDKRFSRTEIPVGDGFLQTKMVQYESVYPQEDDLLELFLKVNDELRTKNREQLVEIGRKSAGEPLWSGRFLRQPGAARRAAFGTRRSYTYNGEQVDRQIHLGVDLASVARDQVPAANAGRVVYAGWLGIYGQVLILDHGLGLQSMYAHLSQLQVSEGQEVDKGQIIGRTGATGLAGGDHLHFAMLVSGVPVNPVEWWDSAWIENNVRSKLELRELQIGAEQG